MIDITAEEFVDKPKSGIAPTDFGKSKYDLFREEMAKKLGVPTENVDIFTVRNHPTLKRTVDVRFAAHGSPYYRPSKLDGILNENRADVRTHTCPHSSHIVKCFIIHCYSYFS